jgi:hypothetical protein
MRRIILTWKTCGILALVLITTSLFLYTSATGGSVFESIVALPYLPVLTFEAIVLPFSFWVGLAFSTPNQNGPIEIFAASVCSLLALVLIAAGAIDILRRRSDGRSS